jgi:hypothetical protein
MGCVLLFFAMLTLWLEENEPRSATSSGIRPASQAG